MSQPLGVGACRSHDLAIGHQDVDVRLGVRVVEALQKRDALHVLRFLERVRNVVGPHDAEPQVEAFAQQAPHLLVDGDAASRHDRQIAGRRQLDDSALDEHAPAGSR